MRGTIYDGKKVLVTGAFGFKGSWLTRWLRMMGATVCAIGHEPNTVPNHHQILTGRGNNINDIVVDLLDYEALENTIRNFKPEIVFHLAAHSIVTRCIKDPKEALENNFMAAVNLLEAVRLNEKNLPVIIITSDKVYSNQEWIWGYREGDMLCGIDPYSASKVCVEHAVYCYQEMYGMNIMVARAGNVIGGGDWNQDRLIPDIVKAAAKGESVKIATPDATRPWQHVVDALGGYLLLGKLAIEQPDFEHKHWNFGPTDEEMTVGEVVKAAKGVWGDIKYEFDEQDRHKHPVNKLRLDSTRAYKYLWWENALSMRWAVQLTVSWYSAFYNEGYIMTNRHIEAYGQKHTNLLKQVRIDYEM